MVSKYNPFNPNAIVIPSLFAGRNQMVATVIRKLEQVKRGMSSSFVFTGERGIGKTALAKYIKHLATANQPQDGNLNFLTSYYAVEKNQNFEYVLQTALNTLTDQLPHASLKRLTERLGSIFKNGKFNFGAFSMEMKATDEKERQHLKDQAVSIFTNILKGFEESGNKKEFNGLLIILDEIHNLIDIDGVSMLIRNISTTLDVNELGKISFLIIGYQEAIDKFFNSDPSAKRHFDQFSLDCVPTAEAKEILVKGFKEIGMKYDEAALNEFIDYTGGYPHSIQVLGHNLIEVDTDNHITKADWIKAIDQTAIELQTKDFSNFYNFAKKETTNEMLLNIMAIASKPLNKTELGQYLKGKNIYRTIQQLKKIGAIKEDAETGNIWLSSFLFRTAILMHIIPKIKEKDYLQEIYNKFRNGK